MLTLAPAPRPRRRRASASRIGLAMAGGGPIGCTYEMGALRALEEAVEGLDLRGLDVYVGISSGAFIAAARMDFGGPAAPSAAQSLGGGPTIFVNAPAAC